MNKSTIDILSDAFDGNGSIQYATNNSSKRRKALIRYSYQQARLKGQLYKDGDTAALLIFKDKRVGFLKELPSTLYLVFNSLQFNTLKVAKKEERIKAIHQQH
jgi:hypothetical protein